MKMSPELEKKYDQAKTAELLERIQNEEPKAKTVSKDPLAQQTLSKLSRYSRYFLNATMLSEATVKLGSRLNEFHQSGSFEEISHGFHIGGLLLNALNFFRIPFMYLSAFVLGQKVPVTLNNNMRLAYSTVVLGLGITATALPITAPVIAFVATGIGFTTSLFLLGRIIQERIKLAKIQKALANEVIREEEAISVTQDEAKQLKAFFENATEEAHIIDLQIEVALLQERHQLQKKILGSLYEQQAQNKQLKEALGNKVMFRSLLVVLGALVITGLVFSLFFPPIGLGILASAATLSCALVLARLLAPSLHRLFKRVSAPSPQEPSNQSPEDLKVNEHKQSLTEAKVNKKAEDSSRELSYVGTPTKPLFQPPKPILKPKAFEKEANGDDERDRDAKTLKNH